MPRNIETTIVPLNASRIKEQRANRKQSKRAKGNIKTYTRDDADKNGERFIEINMKANCAAQTDDRNNKTCQNEGGAVLIESKQESDKKEDIDDNENP
jgi:hypothetical protein